MCNYATLIDPCTSSLVVVAGVDVLKMVLEGGDMCVHNEAIRQVKQLPSSRAIHNRRWHTVILVFQPSAMSSIM